MPIIAGNWKMNKSLAQGLEWVSSLDPVPAGVTAALFPPATLLLPLLAGLKDRSVMAGCQDCHWENSGAYTGEISPVQLAEDGVGAVLVGH